MKAKASKRESPKALSPSLCRRLQNTSGEISSSKVTCHDTCHRMPHHHAWQPQDLDRQRVLSAEQTLQRDWLQLLGSGD